MRQPLNQLIDISQKLLNEKPRNDQQGQIQQLQFAGNEILVLLNDMLDFSNIEAGKLSLNN
jgi:signal transduction histidine kinase